METSYDYGASSAATGAATGIFSFIMFFYLAIAVLLIIAVWKIFTKAGKPGWASIIPFYNIYVLLQIVGRPGWWLLLYFIPFVNFVIMIIVALDLAKSFGKSALFGVFGLLLFSIVGYPMLAFGSAKYVGAGAGSAPSTPSTPSAPQTA